MEKIDVQNIFFIVDWSSSMHGAPAEAINAFFSELSHCYLSNDDSLVQRILYFAEGPVRKNPPTECLERASCLSKALNALPSVLEDKNYPQTLCLLSDGFLTDTRSALRDSIENLERRLGYSPIRISVSSLGRYEVTGFGLREFTNHPSKCIFEIVELADHITTSQQFSFK